MNHFIFGLLLGGLSVFLFFTPKQEPKQVVNVPIEVTDSSQETQMAEEIATKDKKVMAKKQIKVTPTQPQYKEDEKSIENACRKHFSSLSKREKIMWVKNIDPNNPHPGAVEELPPGTMLSDGTMVGEVEASLYIEHFEKDLFEKLKELDSDEIREKYADELHWFQRVGNSRTAQKCMALQKMQLDFGLNTTSFKRCASNIMKTEKVTWGDWKNNS